MRHAVLDRLAHGLPRGAQAKRAPARAVEPPRARRRVDPSPETRARAAECCRAVGRSNLKLTPELAARLAELYANHDLKVRAIAAALGVTAATVANWRRRLGLAPRRSCS